MADPVLRRYYVKTTVADNWATLVPTVPAGRVVVISKLTLYARLASQSGLRWWDGGTERLMNFDMPFQLYDLWTESGLVVPAGDSLQVWSRLVNAFDAMAFGEEVDV